ncbi:MAG TPA: SOS response-associated peptidase [Gemmatimonadaceae bacterium]|nr:SOS response-associated peptidase [Gemmatimonadaceae bacterium]
MCGRAVVINPDGIDRAVFGFSHTLNISAFRPRYNLNPREDIPAVFVDPDRGHRVLSLLHWNLVPGSVPSRQAAEAFDRQFSTFNAKIERVDTAPTFRVPWRRQRALVIVDGIIEWVGEPGRKIPHLIQQRDGRPFALAGLWDRWVDRAGGPDLWSCTVLVGPPTPWFARFHHRMGIFLPPVVYDRWLDPDLIDPRAVRALIDGHPFPEGELTARSISTRVNNPRYDAPDCLDPAA